MIQFSTASFSVSEDVGSVTVTVTRSGNTATTSSVNYATSNGSASSPGDYNAISGTLTFAPGESSKSFNVVINNDSTKEQNETFNVILGGVSNGLLGSPIAVTITIVDNDKRSRIITPRVGPAQKLKILRETDGERLR